jgi:DNA invertase Pin-like site-specific DNA recombinase
MLPEPSGRLLFHVLAAADEFEPDLIRELVVAGIRRARTQGRRLGRPRLYRVDLAEARRLRVVLPPDLVWRLLTGQLERGICDGRRPLGKGDYDSV